MKWLLTPMLAMKLVAITIPPVSDGTPNRQPQMASGNGIVALAFGSGHAVMVALSKDGGETFAKPQPIADLPALALGRHRGPRIAISGKTLLVSAINVDLLVWRSTDGGKSWSQPITVNDTPGAAREGLDALAAADSGHVAAVWLDLRSKGTRLYGAFSNDAGATWSRNMLVYESPEGTICQCCHPSLTAAGKAEFAVMFRNSVGGNRDMYLLRVRDGKLISQPRKLGVDSWALNACPMDGGGIALADGQVVTAWRRGQDVFLAEPGRKETKIGSGIDVSLATGRGKTYAVWTRAGAVESWDDGKTEALSKSGAFPVLTSLPDGGVLAAWEEGDAIRIQRITAGSGRAPAVSARRGTY